MRVVHLTSRHPADDVRIFHKECCSLARGGFDVHLVAPDATDETREGVALHGFEQPGGPRPLRIVLRLWRAWRAARALAPEVCHFHEPELVPAALLLQRSGTRLVYDVHEDALSELDYAERAGGGRKTGLRVFEAIARRRCDAFVAATPAIAELFPPERTIELRNYPRTEEFRAVAPERGASRDVVYVGGIITRARGLMEMVEAMALIRDEAARLVLIGAMGTPELERDVRALPGWRRVEHVGFVGREELAERLDAARLGLVVLHPERGYLTSLPIKLFEYMAAALPVIASDFPYWRELLEPIGCAVFVDPLDVAAIAAAIDELLADDERAAEMGRRGAAAVRDGLNWQNEEAKLLDFYGHLAQATA